MRVSKERREKNGGKITFKGIITNNNVPELMKDNQYPGSRTLIDMHTACNPLGFLNLGSSICHKYIYISFIYINI